ncbi:ATP-dependent DNA helicase, partial [Propionibacterium freudenreichii]|nr:ATP-dependent DNA helicase [Propionibacterium freudenreichii]
AEVVALREWVAEQARDHELADRDDAPAHTGRAWAQVSISARQCPGSRCPLYNECFVEMARARARAADLIITNHALLAIDAMSDRDILPEHAAVIIDEAHELTARVTGAASQELSPQQIERLSRSASDWIDDDLAVELLDVADALTGAIAEAEVGRLTNPHSTAVAAIARVRDVARKAVSALSPGSS